MDKIGKRPETARLQVCLLVAIAWFTPGAPAARADLHFQDTTVQLGEVKTGARLVQSFPFRNDGPESVEITDTRPSCGCLAPRLEKALYGSGEQGALLLEIHTLSQSPGPQTWTVQVRYRPGADWREKQLRLTARIVSEIAVEPAALTVFADTEVSHDLILTDVRDQHLTIAAVQSTSPFLAAQLAGKGHDASGHWSCKIHLKVEQAFPAGRHEEAVHLYTSDPVYPDLKVPVTIIKQLRQRVSALPGQVRWEADADAPLPSQLVRLRDRDNQAVVVDQVTADDPAITCRWAEGPGTMATLRVMVDGKRLTRGRLQSAVHVQLRRPARDTVTIPVAVVRRAD